MNLNSSTRSFFGLSAAKFLQLEMAGVIMARNTGNIVMKNFPIHILLAAFVLSGQTRQQYHPEIVVSIPDRELFLIADGTAIRKYSVLVGSGAESTPVGHFHISEQMPQNDAVLGSVWMGFDYDQTTGSYYGIHGKGPDHDPDSTSGCVALENADAEDLYRRVTKGTSVEIVDASITSAKDLPAPPIGASLMALGLLIVLMHRRTA